jgi:hypothetical protein
VIGPGWLPRPRPWRAGARSITVRTRSYMVRNLRKRARRASAPKTGASATRSVNHEVVAFDHGPHEFPVATLRAHDPGARARALLGDLRGWLVARWQWFRPRTVPVLAAITGMVLVLQAADYLTHAHGSVPDRADASTAGIEIAQDVGVTTIVFDRDRPYLRLTASSYLALTLVPCAPCATPIE